MSVEKREREREREESYKENGVSSSQGDDIGARNGSGANSL